MDIFIGTGPGLPTVGPTLCPGYFYAFPPAARAGSKRDGHLRERSTIAGCSAVNTSAHERKPADLAAIRLVMIEDDTLVSDLLSLAFRNRLQVQDVRVFSSGREGLAT